MKGDLRLEQCSGSGMGRSVVWRKVVPGQAARELVEQHKELSAGCEKRRSDGVARNVILASPAELNNRLRTRYECHPRCSANKEAL